MTDKRTIEQIENDIISLKNHLSSLEQERQEMISSFLCPMCGSSLKYEDRCYRCQQEHGFCGILVRNHAHTKFFVSRVYYSVAKNNIIAFMPVDKEFRHTTLYFRAGKQVTEDEYLPK